MANTQGLRLARLMMVLSSLAPLFVLWAVRGIGPVPDRVLVPICLAFVVVPALVLWLRVRAAAAARDVTVLSIGKVEDHREHLLVYLFAVLLPLYDANLGGVRNLAATLVAFLFVVLLFWHLNLHYMNLLFALRGYRVFTIYPPDSTGTRRGRPPLVLLTRRTVVPVGAPIRAFRLSDTVFLEPPEGL